MICPYSVSPGQVLWFYTGVDASVPLGWLETGARLRGERHNGKLPWMSEVASVLFQGMVKSCPTVYKAATPPVPKMRGLAHLLREAVRQ